MLKKRWADLSGKGFAPRRRALLLAAALSSGVFATLALADAGAPALVPAAKPIADEAARLRGELATIKLPPGFEITLYALVPGARTIAVGPQGKMIFVGTPGTQVYALPVRPGAALVGEVSEFAPATMKKMPHGVCFANDGTLFVAEQNRILSFANAEADYDKPAPKAQTVVAQGQLIPAEDESDNHSTRVCRVGPDNKLYVSLGQPYNVPPKDKQAQFARLGIGAIIRMDRDGKRRKIYASGIRNSVGLDFNPADKTLWFTDNQVDRMGDDIPPGELNRATRAGQNFGFPWYGGGHVRTNEYKDETPPKDVVFPEVEMVAHAADLGMTFYTGSQFPKDYRGGIFSVQHGSWNRTVPVGARVMFTSLKPDGTAAKSEPFAEGWLEPDGSYWGRPVDAAQLPDGSLLITDDYNGALYRLAYTAR
ncbi:Sorbosone dehydrogenase [Methylocella tundrae]|uniref:Sorbosone dehydrogenase n=1 Tax=Methylocella tundrae TaxID=227605 RepID=A0A4U8YTQ6_METTU|nr:Sorbosone dehydrogenase [Methylocella tundrae]